MFGSLKANTALQTLDMTSEQQQDRKTKQAEKEQSPRAGNKLGVEAARALGEALKYNASLTSLNLSSGKVTPQSRHWMAMQTNQHKAQTDNRFNTEAVGLLAEGLKVNTALWTLQIERELHSTA